MFLSVLCWSLFKGVVNILLYYVATACTILANYKPQNFSKTRYGATNSHATPFYILHGKVDDLVYNKK